MMSEHTECDRDVGAMALNNWKARIILIKNEQQQHNKIREPSRISSWRPTGEDKSSKVKSFHQPNQPRVIQEGHDEREEQ